MGSYYSHTANVQRAKEQERQKEREPRAPEGGFYGQLTDKYYSSEEAMRHYEREEAMRRDVPSPEEVMLDKLPPEGIRRLFNKAAAEESERQAALTTQQDILAFCELHPEFDNGNSQNGVLVANYWRSRGVRWPNLHQLEEAYESLVAANLLRLNQDILQQQEKEEAERRASDFRARTFKTVEQIREETADMSLEDLRRVATQAGF